MRDTRQARQRREGERKVLAWIDQQAPGCTIKELQERTQTREATIRSILKTLCGQGKVVRERVSQDSGGWYFRYYMRTRIEPMRADREKVLKLINEEPPGTVVEAGGMFARMRRKP